MNTQAGYQLRRYNQCQPAMAALRTPYLEHMYGTEFYAFLQKVKQIFDPYGTLNPGVKFGSSHRRYQGHDPYRLQP
jgi:hypothetical protein